VGLVSYGLGDLVVAHVGRRLLFGRSPRQCAMPRHNGNLASYVRACENFFQNAKKVFFFE
jgi:hypothetical protein